MSRLIYSECGQDVLAEIDGKCYWFGADIKDLASGSDEKFLALVESDLRDGVPYVGCRYSEAVQEAKDHGIIFPEEENNDASTR